MQTIKPIVFHTQERKEFAPKTWLQKALNWALVKLDTPKAPQWEEIEVDLAKLETELLKQIDFTLEVTRSRPKYILVGRDLLNTGRREQYFQFQYPEGYFFQGIRIIYIPNMLGVIAIPDPETI